MKIHLRKTLFPTLNFNEKAVCSTYPVQHAANRTLWFPNNFLRNVARLPQKQMEIESNLPDFFIGIDVDLVPSPDFVFQLSNFISTKPQKKKNLYSVIVFEAKNEEVISSIKDRVTFKRKRSDYDLSTLFWPIRNPDSE